MQFDSLANYKNSASYLHLDQGDIAYWQSKKSDLDAPYGCFVHGFPSASWDWQHQWQALEGNYNLIACDLLGFGVSSKPHPHKYSVVEQADIVLAVLAHCNIQECHIVAHDYGVSVAQEILSQLDQKAQVTEMSKVTSPATALRRILSICFLNGGLFAESHRPIITQKLLKSSIGPVFAKLMSKSTMRKGFNKVFSKHHPPSDREIDMLWELLHFNSGTHVLPSILTYIDERAVHRDKWVNSMGDASFPIGFINGVHDPVSGQHMLEQFMSLFPNYPSRGIDVGHYPQLEDPQLVTSLIEAFLETGKLS